MRSIALLAAALALTPAAAHSQGGDVDRPFEYSFTAPVNEVVRLQLDAGRYRAEISGTAIQLRLRPLEAGMQSPRVREALSGISAGDTRYLEIQSYAAGVYELRAIGGEAGRSVTIRVVREPARPARASIGSSAVSGCAAPGKSC